MRKDIRLQIAQWSLKRDKLQERLDAINKFLNYLEEAYGEEGDENESKVKIEMIKKGDINENEK